MFDDWKVFLALPAINHVEPQAEGARLTELMRCTPRITTWIQHSGSLLPYVRNTLARQALQAYHNGSADWVWWLDSDMILPDPIQAAIRGEPVVLGTLARLLGQATEHNLPVVGGLCFSGDGRPVVKRRTGETVFDLPKSGLLKVEITGFACLLMRMDVLEGVVRRYGDLPFQMPQMPKPGAPKRVTTADEVFDCWSITGEDVFFCGRLLEMGIPVHIDCGVNVGHLKPRIVNRETYEREWPPERIRAYQAGEAERYRWQPRAGTPGTLQPGDVPLPALKMSPSVEPAEGVPQAAGGAAQQPQAPADPLVPLGGAGAREAAPALPLPAVPLEARQARRQALQEQG